MNQIGLSVKRLEDPPLLTGRGRFAADISFRDQVHMRVVRSPTAHARLADIDVSAAIDLPGVVAAWTASDIADLPPIDYRMTKVPGLDPYRQPVLANGLVRYVGEPICVVFAEDQYVAEDAAERVMVEFDDMPPLTDATSEPGRFDDRHDTEVAVIEKSTGEVDAQFADAYAVIELRLAVGRQSAVPLETRGALARFDPASGRLELFGAAKVPHYNRDAIASMLGIPRSSISLREGHVGGGFGVRGELYPEDVLVCLAARRLGRPVKWIEDRREHLMATNHSRDQVHHIRAAVDEDGYIRGVVDEFWLNQGAYVRTHAATVPDLTAALLPGPYVWPAYRVTGHIRLTNKTPAGTYRAPGRFEGTFVRERLLDVVAGQLGLDPAEARRRNLIPASAMPFDRGIEGLGTEVVYDSGDYAVLLERVLTYLDYDSLVADLERRRGEGELVGLGLGFFVEKSGLGPFDGVRVSVDEQGRVTVLTGVASVGQGIETVIAQICAETLAVDPSGVRVCHGQTDDLAFGMGAFASRVTVMTGSATHIAAEHVKEKALITAAGLLKADSRDLVLDDGRIHVRGSPNGAWVTLGDVAKALRPGPAGSGPPGLTAEEWFRTDHMTYPYGLHAAVVEVDGGTGGVTVERYVVAYDVGRAINPRLIEGQIVGGAAQGIGGALFEEFPYDEHGQPLATSLMDYLMPTSMEMPPVEVLLSEDAPSPLNPLGVKGAGEAGITAAGAAIANAIADALEAPEAITSIPVSPGTIRELVASSVHSVPNRAPRSRPRRRRR